MEGLFSLIWVVFIVVTLTNALTGKNKTKQQGQKQSPVPPLTAKPITSQAKPAAEQTRMPLASSRPAPPATVATPQVHPHLSLDCDLDGPSGSMDFTSTEGVDPCHDDDLPSRTAPRPSYRAPQEQPGLTLEWTGDALVKSFIMQEILTRPSQRQRR